MSKKEAVFYLSAGFAALLHEISVIYGVAICTFLPLVFGVMAVGFWAFGKQKFYD